MIFEYHYQSFNFLEYNRLILDLENQPSTFVPHSRMAKSLLLILTLAGAALSQSTISMVAITQISDGQIQAPTGTPPPPPQPTSTMMAISQISDGQIQAPTGTPAPAPSTTPIAISTQPAIAPTTYSMSSVVMTMQTSITKSITPIVTSTESEVVPTKTSVPSSTFTGSAPTERVARVGAGLLMLGTLFSLL